MHLRIALGTGLACALLTISVAPAQAHTPHHAATHEVCRDVRIRDRPTDDHRIAGTAIGAVAGGLLGHQIGGGKGKTLATVGGAVAGGYVGNRVQRNHQHNHATYHTERRCHQVTN